MDIATCSSLTMYDFIQIVCDKQPQPEWWQSLYDEYNELSGETGDKQTLLASQITYIQNKIKIVSFLVGLLWVRRNDEAIELLQDMGFYLPYEDLHADLERVMLMLKGDELELNRANAEYKELSEKTNKEPTKSTELDWYNILAMLGSHNHTVLNPKQLSVLEYIAYEIQFRQWIAVNQPKTEQWEQ